MKWKKIGSRKVTILNAVLGHEAQINALKRFLGWGYTRRIVIIENDMATLFCYEKEFRGFEKFLTKKIIHEKRFLKYNIDFFHRTVKKLITSFHFIKRLNLKKLSNQELYKLLSKIEKDYISLLIFGPLTGRVISAAFQENILQQAKKEKLDVPKIKNHISQLVIPVGEDMGVEEEKRLIKIVNKIYRQNKLVKIFKNRSVSKIIRALKSNYPVLFQEIYRHYENYNWLPIFFENLPWSLGYFIKRIKCMSNNKNHLVRLNEIKNTENKILLEQRKLIKELKITYSIVKFIYQAGQYLVLRTLFAQRAGYVNYNLGFIYKEIARRHGLKLGDLKQLTIQEIYWFLLKNNKTSISEINKRRKLCVFDSCSNKHQIFIGKKARKIKKGLEKLTDIRIDDSKELKGNIANRGIAKGKVRIIHKPDDVKKFKKGEIIVASMTSVDMVSATKKAVAIVTDEGGITCHAAIISRELGTPCIIGTNIATKVLKDGQLVEVDANGGVIKILK